MWQLSCTTTRRALLWVKMRRYSQRGSSAILDPKLRSLEGLMTSLIRVMNMLIALILSIETPPWIRDSHWLALYRSLWLQDLQKSVNSQWKISKGHNLIPPCLMLSQKLIPQKVMNLSPKILKWLLLSAMIWNLQKKSNLLEWFNLTMTLF